MSVEPELLEAIRRLSDEVFDLRKEQIFASAQLRALNTYTTWRLSQLCQHDREAEFEVLEGRIRKAYDEAILQIEETDAVFAAKADLRNHLPELDQLRWFAPD